MGSPVEPSHNPFDDLQLMAEHSPLMSPQQDRSRQGSVEDGPYSADQVDRPREKKRVGFTGETTPTPRSGSLTPAGSGLLTPVERYDSDAMLLPSTSIVTDHRSHLPHLSIQDTEQIKQAFAARIAKPRPAIRSPSNNVQPSMVDSEDDSDGLDIDKAHRRQKAREALQRGKALEEENVRIMSEPPSPVISPGSGLFPDRRPSDFNLDRDNEIEIAEDTQDTSPPQVTSDDEYLRGRESHKHARRPFYRANSRYEPRSGASTPVAEREYIEDYRPAPHRYQSSLLGAILELRDKLPHPDSRRHERNIPSFIGTSTTYARHNSKGNLLKTSPEPTPSLGPTPSDSGTSTPRGWHSPWYFGSRQHSSTSVHESTGGTTTFGQEVSQRLKKHKDEQRKLSLGNAVDLVTRQINKARKKEEHRIKRHISEVLQRQKYLLQLCKSLITYGAPSHRLEEYLNMSARALAVDAQFLYLPNAMIVSFQDPSTHTTNVKLVKEPPGLDLGKMRDVHEIYKEVVHDRISAHEGLTRLHEVSSRGSYRWQRLLDILTYGIASMAVAPFAFGAQYIDLGPCFVLGCLVGFLRWVAERNKLYNDVFEVVAAILSSFLARLIGSINHGNTFCFSSMVQSSLALILPGYMVLMASLELQSRNWIAGSVRMVYAFIYSLTLGFGITIGTAICGAILSNPTSATTCTNQIPDKYNSIFVLIFTVALMLISRARLSQSPSMIVVSLVGWAVNFYVSKRLRPSAQIASALGAFVIGCLANGYSRFSPRVGDWMMDKWLKLQARRARKKHQSPRHLEEGKSSTDTATQSTQPPRIGRSLAAAVMLPAIFVQVPSGLAINGSLLSGLLAANELTSSATGNVTQPSSGMTIEGTNYGTAFNVGFSVIQIALGITTGLFMAAVIWYPVGKRRSALFSF